MLLQIVNLGRKKFKKIQFDNRVVEFEEWKKFAILDGGVCRNDRDCIWIDPNLGCDDRDFNIDEIEVISFFTFSKLRINKKEFITTDIHRI